MTDPEILILGGGPSGLSTALHLARDFPHLTSRILILEKARYPRHKLCAGGLMIDAELILERLGLDVSEIPHADADIAHLDFAGRGMSIQTKGRRTLRIIRRNEFDAWLAGKAESRGIEIRQGVTVKNVQAGKDDVIVETDAGTFTAQVVVGADGSNGATHRCVLPDAPVHTARVLEVLTPVIASSVREKQSRIYGENVSGKNTPRNDIHMEKEAYFDFFCVPAGIAGYTWDFPTQVDGQPMRCWGIYDTNILAHRQRPPFKELLAEEMSRHGVKVEDYELKGFPIRWFSPFNSFSVPRVILVGDAAGADPIFGEGISIALGYGQVAAQVIGEAFPAARDAGSQRRDFSFHGYKRRLLRSALGRALIARWLITQILYRLRWSWFQRAFWRRMGWLIWPVSSRLVINWAKRT